MLGRCQKIGIILFLFILFFVFQVPLWAGTDEKNYPGVDSSYTPLTIHELQKNARPGGFNIEGYVVLAKPFACPPATEKKPCIEEHIIISENNKLREQDTFYLTDNELILFVKNINQFELGKKYKFSIMVTDVVFLVGYDPVKE